MYVHQLNGGVLIIAEASIRYPQTHYYASPFDAEHNNRLLTCSEVAPYLQINHNKNDKNIFTIGTEETAYEEWVVKDGLYYRNGVSKSYEYWREQFDKAFLDPKFCMLQGALAYLNWLKEGII